MPLKPPPPLAVLVDRANEIFKSFDKPARQTWINAGWIERRFFRTQDREAYDVEVRQFRIRVVRETRSLLYQMRVLFGKKCIVEIRATYQGGFPRCLLVRVPKPGTMLMDEVLVGSPPRDDEQLHEIAARIKRDTRRDRRMMQTEQRIARRQALLAEAERKTIVAQLAYAEALDIRKQMQAQGVPTTHPEYRANSMAMYRAAAAMKRFRHAAVIHTTWLAGPRAHHDYVS